MTNPAVGPTPPLGMPLINVTDLDFEAEVLRSQLPVVVDFWADWCGPCKAIAPTLEQINQSRSDLLIAKLNVDENPATPARYGVRGLPTLLIFKNGNVVAAKIGALPRTQLVEWINASI